MAGAAAEIPGAAAGKVASMETKKAVRNALDKWDPDGNVLQHDAQNEVSLVLGGMAGGAAAAVATDAVVATAGVAAALVTGTNIGLAVGSVGGPAGWLLGAAAGATLGLVIWAISSIFS